jgi:HlyD family secretion protein
MLTLKRLTAAALVVALTGCEQGAEYPVVGTLERDRIELVAELSEPITNIHVREGQRVEAGTVLVEQDRRRAEAELTRLEAAVDRLRHRLDELLRGPRQEAIDEARARLVAAEAALATARDELRRLEPLQARNLISQSQLDTARNSRDQSQGAVDAARAALAALVEGTTADELEQARAAVREAEASSEAQRLTLERLTMSAPRAALVESLPFEPGETPRPGAPVVLLLAADQAPYARVYVPASLHHQFQPGSRVSISIDGHGERMGQVRHIAGETAFTPYFALTEHDAGRLSYLAEIDLEDAESLPSGIPVRAVAPDTAGGAGNGQ